MATIKPADPRTLFTLVNRSGMLNTTSTLSAIIKFAYDLHPRQITKGPASWLESEKFDISAKPDTAGIPNPAQLKMMVQKLLKERFQLAFHNEKELSVAITVTKTGPKITKSQSGNNFPAFLDRRASTSGTRPSRKSPACCRAPSWISR